MFLGRVVAPGEPLWLDEDRDYALALTSLESDIHDGCGQPFSESSQPDAEGSYAVTPVRCHACAALQRQSQKFLEGANPSAGAGLTFYVRKK